MAVEIESLRQQLASCDAEIERLKTVPMRYRRMAFNAQLQNENTQLCQQLAAALAACKLKDVTLESAHNGLRWWMDAFPLHVTEADNEEMLKLVKALAIQPDDSTLNAWLGEPVAWLHEKRQDSDVITDAVKNVWNGVVVGKDAAYSIPLYSPKGLK